MSRRDIVGLNLAQSMFLKTDCGALAVEIDLRQPSMLHGKKGFERIVWAFKNVINHSVTWLFHDFEKDREGVHLLGVGLDMGWTELTISSRCLDTHHQTSSAELYSGCSARENGSGSCPLSRSHHRRPFRRRSRRLGSRHL